ncbi:MULTISPECIES: hypothetical protein [Nocardiopsis]|uniref:DUF2637 domain-containing protein n=1 Tax=Nocardiopsis changdeensis TaxID=2831969 RepID=A0ABX8BVV7_9ACTN|nr:MULTISPECIES: hypothetical protein [Nocardiopsis]QUX26375.1 hypothetical protein KGD84_32255 [Nocardiopsis changdeensis]QYX40805.1 hypothetical protein K1J57_32920 [Nocardiopsis sp. MT53]
MERETTETPKKTTTDPDTTVASRIDPVRIGATVVTGASAAFTAWTVWDMLSGIAPDALALGLGVGVEALWLWLLAIEWRQAGLTGQVHRLLTLTGWVLAGAAAAVLIAHGVTEGSWVLLALAVFPVASKGGWHWLTHSHAAATLARLAESARRRDRSAALSTDLTEDDEVELAEIRRKAAKAKAKAAAEAELAAAEAEADRLRQEAEAAAERVRQETEHQMRQDALRRSLEAQMAAQRADADLLKQRFALEQELRIMRPIGAGPAIGNEQVPDDASAITGPLGGTATAGFGFPQSAPPRREPTVDDRAVPRVPTPGGEGERNRAAVLAAYERLAADGTVPSVSAIATEAGVSRRTVNRHLPPQMRG